jgi:hypothetical protein
MLYNVFRKALLDEMTRFSNITSYPDRPYNIGPPSRAIAVIYRGTTSTSPARRFLVDWCLGFGRRHHYDRLDGKEFLVDLTRALSNKIGIDSPYSQLRGVSLRPRNYML